MRAELNNLENIDLYLSGKMTAAQKGAFEAQMAADPALKSVVQDQQLLIQTVNRKALMAEINTVAGITTAAVGTAWTLSKILWAVAGSVVAVGAISAAIYVGVTGPENEDMTLTGANGTDENTEEYVEPFVSLGEEDPNWDGTISEMDSEIGEMLADLNSDLNASGADNGSDENSHSNGGNNDDVGNNDSNNDGGNGNSLAAGEQDEDGGASESDGNNAADNASNAFNNNGNNGSTTSSWVKGSKANAKNRSNNRDLKTFSNAYLSAEFKGGDVKMSKWVKKRIRYPETPKRKELEAVVKVSFFVDENGNKDGIRAELIRMHRHGEAEEPFSKGKLIANRKSVRYFEREAARIVRIMPRWDPATDRFGNPVLSESKLYVKFDLDRGCFVYDI